MKIEQSKINLSSGLGQVVSKVSMTILQKSPIVAFCDNIVLYESATCVNFALHVSVL